MRKKQSISFTTMILGWNSVQKMQMLHTYVGKILSFPLCVRRHMWQCVGRFLYAMSTWEKEGPLALDSDCPLLSICPTFTYSQFHTMLFANLLDANLQSNEAEKRQSFFFHFTYARRYMTISKYNFLKARWRFTKYNACASPPMVDFR